MPEDIAGFGLEIRVLASNTFPAPGLTITEFADDGDPLDSPSLDIAGSAMALNGQLVTWTTANEIPITINMIAGAEDDRNLTLLFESNRAGANKKSSKDVITMTVSYPDGSTTLLTGGVCKAFIPTSSVASEGRLKSKPFVFSFENKTTVPAL